MGQDIILVTVMDISRRERDSIDTDVHCLQH